MKKIICILLAVILSATLCTSGVAFGDDTVPDGSQSAASEPAAVQPVTGWNADKTQYLVDGVPVKGFQIINGKTFYFDETTALKATGITKIGEDYYYFSVNGVLKTGWKKKSGARYYFSKKNGKAIKGLKKISGKKYYFSEEGKMQTGWQTVNGKTYFFVRSKKRADYGQMLKGIVTIDGKIYNLGKNGVLVTDEDAMSQKASTYDSPTSYLILVSKAAHKVGIYQGSKGNWTRVKYYDCTLGAPSTPTPTGNFIMGPYQGRPYHQRYFDSGRVRCWYATRIIRGINFHSVLYTQISTPSRVADGRLGMNLSHGCVRLKIKQAKWIYDHIPVNTRCVIY